MMQIQSVQLYLYNYIYVCTLYLLNDIYYSKIGKRNLVIFFRLDRLSNVTTSSIYDPNLSYFIKKDTLQ
mgnify:CR=1 FL=1